jgi:hypothetical protein
LTGFKRHHPSGHLYYDMKDSRGRVSCVQWRDSAKRLRFEPADGMQVRAHGSLGIYEVQGRLQLYVDALQPSGLGELQAALERLKARLAEEGLFAPERKRAIPAFPGMIGVITSPTGAAVRDIFRVLRERWPVAEIIFRPCQVQGEGAGDQIVRALADLTAETSLDVIILGRGGGSIEDLWAFNEEAVVRAVAGSRILIITGIGHEIDITLSDFGGSPGGHPPRRPSKPCRIGRISSGGSVRSRDKCGPGPMGGFGWRIFICCGCGEATGCDGPSISYGNAPSVSTTSRHGSNGVLRRGSTRGGDPWPSCHAGSACAIRCAG